MELVSTSKERGVRRLLLVCFFLSGACGLIYEIVWLRVLGIVFGNTTYATSAVLAGFMAGLGFGALFFGRLIDRGGNPVRIYGFLEGGIAVYSFLTPALWKLIEHLNVSFYGFFSPSFLIGSLFKFGLSFVALMIPTFLMGGTLPVLSRFFSRGSGHVARDVGMLYALNTFGAVVGVFLSGFILLYALGVWQTTVLAGSINFLIFFLCLRLARNFSGENPPALSAQKTERAVSSSTTWVRWCLLVLFGVSGAMSMVYEIGWTRVLALMVGSSVYAFSIMLITFLFGIALGSYAFSFVAKKMKAGLVTFALLEVATAVLVLRGLNGFYDMPYYFVKLYEVAKNFMWRMEFGKFLFCAWVMLPPTICIGALFACFIHVYHRSAAVGGEVGTAYCANTVGTIAGSILTAFVLIPAWGIQNSLVFAALASAGIGVAAFFLSFETARWKRFALAACAIFIVSFGKGHAEPWDQSMMTSGIAVTVPKAAGINKDDLWLQIKQRNTLFYKEGIGSTVSVNRYRDQMTIAVNGKVEGSNRGDLFTQSLLGHLPLLLHPGAKKVLVIGLGSGSTNAAVASHDVERIDTVEIEPAVVEAAGTWLAALNRHVLQDPRMHLDIDDGRNYLAVHPDRYDVIISEPSNPWMAGVANLFSVEHYELMKTRLAPKGIVCQWVHAYSMSSDDLRMIIRTFAASFPHVSLWTPFFPDLMLIGSSEPLAIDMNALRAAWKNPEIRMDFFLHGVSEPEGFLSCYWLGDAELRKLAGEGRMNYDNVPYLEFSAPRYLYRNTLKENYLMLNRVRGTYPQIFHLDPPIMENQVFHNALAKGYAYKLMYEEAKVEMALSERINPESANLFLVKGLLGSSAGASEEAMADFSKAAELDPGSAQAHYELGRAMMSRNAWQNAIREFELACDLFPDYVPYRFELGETYRQAGEFERAAAIYESILDMPQDGLFFNRFESVQSLAQMALAQKQYSRAITILLQAVQEYPTQPELREMLGLAYEAEGAWHEAQKVFQELVDRFPEEPTYFTHLAMVYEEMGDAIKLKATLEALILRHPSWGSKPEIKKGLARLREKLGE